MSPTVQDDQPDCGPISPGQADGRISLLPASWEAIRATGRLPVTLGCVTPGSGDGKRMFAVEFALFTDNEAADGWCLGHPQGGLPPEQPVTTAIVLSAGVPAGQTGCGGRTKDE